MIHAWHDVTPALEGHEEKGEALPEYFRAVIEIPTTFKSNSPRPKR